MTEQRSGWLRRLWSGLDSLRRFTVNLIFLLLLIIVLAALFGDDDFVFPDGAALVLQPSGRVVDQLTFVDPLTQVRQGGALDETLLRDLIEAVDRGAQDERISLLLLALDDLQHIGMSKSHELAAALERFRASGKPILAYAQSYSQDRYLLASLADEVWVSDLGGVALEGFAVYRNYFRSALDKLKINMHVFRVGEYKSAVEPLLRDDMSEEAREANRVWLEQLWQQYSRRVAARRPVQESQIVNYSEEFDRLLQDYDGDGAELALAMGLVDRVASRRELRQQLITAVGENDEGTSFKQIHHRQYLDRTDRQVKSPQGTVAVLPAVGVILDGEQPPGTVGGDTLARMIGETLRDDDIKAVVLRVDSGGGSVFASERIRQELRALSEAGKSVVVSMGSVAASGGYWIAAEADEIWALPSTLTGSIGIFGALPGLEDALLELGIHTDGVSTGPFAGGVRLDKPLSDKQYRVMQAGVDYGYERFLRVVAQGRNMLPAQVEPLARGRVWTGRDAQQLGLVDKLGGLEQAVAAAAGMQGMERYRVEWVTEPLPPGMQLLQELSRRVSSALPQQSSLAAWLQRISQQLSTLPAPLRSLNDPQGLYALCLSCELSQ